MNENINFWRVWENKEKLPLFFAFSVLLLAIGATVYVYFFGQEMVFGWNTVSELNEKIVSLPTYFFGDFGFSSSTPVWYIKERYLPAIAQIPVWVYYLLFAQILTGLSFLLTGFARLRGAWFLAGALVLGGFLISFRLENLYLSNSNGPFLISFVVLGGVYYLSNFFGTRLRPFQILAGWLLSWAIFWLVSLKFSAINAPIAAMVAYALIAMVVITIIFTFISSHEIFAGLVWLVSKNAQKGKNSLPQYFLISAIFFANIILIYLENSNRIDDTGFLLAPVFIFIINGLLGIWGFKQLSEQRQWFSFRQTGLYIYLGLFFIGLATYGFAYSTASDSLIELLNDLVSISTLALSVSFFVYVLINFNQLFKAGLDVHKVLYKSPFNRLIFARTAAVFIILILFSFKNYFSYFQLQSALSSSIGDFYKTEGDLKTAETYYKNATHYELYNQKANLSLASLAASQNDKINAAFFYNQSLQKTPSEQAYLGLSANLENENMYFDALFALKNGQKEFPGSSRIFTNIAYLQTKAKVTDSVLLNLDQALKSCKKCDVEATNFLAFWIENGKSEKLHEMVDLGEKSKSVSYLANLSAIDRIILKSSVDNKPLLQKDSILNMSTAALLFNQTGNAKVKPEHSLLAKEISGLQKQNANDPVFEELSWSYANQQFLRESKLAGIKQLTALAGANTRFKNIYNQTLALWLLQEGLVNQSIERLKIAGDETSVKMLLGSDIRPKMEKSQQEQALKLSKNLTLSNYTEILNKAPLNPYLLVKIADLLTGKKKDSEAYNLLFYATEINNDSPVIWKAYIKKALDLSQWEYATDGLTNLKPLVPNSEYLAYQNLISQRKQKMIFGDF